MNVVYFNCLTSDHETINDVEKIETTISDDELLITYHDGIHKREKLLEKLYITSINVD